MAAYLFEDTCCGDNLCSLMLFLLLYNWRRNLFYYFETCHVIFHSDNRINVLTDSSSLSLPPKQITEPPLT